LSLGVAVFPEHGATPDALLRAADAALYRAKKEGRDRVVAAETATE
jgi:diguanylate cyclase (GGDEF)-like protein